jgi:hypothetical protein
MYQSWTCDPAGMGWVVLLMSNRAERRRAEKAAKKPPAVYHLTQDQIDKMINEAVENALKDLKVKAVDEATRTAFKMFMSIPTMVLHDKFGFGQIRQDRFMRYCMIWYESIQNGETTLKEVVEIAEGLHSIKLKES